MKQFWKLALVFGGVALLASACGSALTPAPGSSATLPIGTFTSALVPGLTTPNTPPPGSNISTCKPSEAHPYPVVLVHATMDNMALDWAALSPMLYDAGYCVYAFNYGSDSSSFVGGVGTFYGLADIATSAGQLATEVNSVLAETGASQVDLVGHSQGGMMPRYYIDNLGGATKVHTFVALAPSNHGTSLDGLTALATAFSSLGFNINGVLGTIGGPSFAEQEAGSPFLTALNAVNDGEVSTVNYVVIESTHDEVVTPYTSAFLAPAPNVQNILLQNQCPSENVGHIGMTYDQPTLDDTLNALGANTPNYQPACTGYGMGL